MLELLSYIALAMIIFNAIIFYAIIIGGIVFIRRQSKLL